MKQVLKEKKQNQQQGNEHLLQFINEAPVGLFEVDINGKFLFINKWFQEISGFSEDKVLSFNFTDLIFEPDKERVSIELAVSANNKSQFKSEFRLLSYDGLIIWVSGIANTQVDKNKKFKGFSGAIVEMSSEKKAKEPKEENELFEKIKESERKLAEAQHIANIGSWEWNIEENSITWTDQLYRIFELKPGTEISLDSYLNCIHPKELDFVKNTIFEAREKKKNFVFQHSILLSNNKVKYLFCRGGVTVNDHNKILIEGTAEDITEKQVAEEIELKKQLQTIEFQSALLKLTQTKYISLIKTYENITKISANQIDTARVGIWLFNEDRTALICYCLFMKNIKKYCFDIVLLKRDAPNYFKALEQNRAVVITDEDDDPLTIELNELYLKPSGISTLLDVPIRSQGRLLGVVCHDHIGTKREWTLEEQTFASSVADLVAIAIEGHNKEKAEKELQLLNEKLVMVNEHKNQFISVISHDLRNPISSIISASSLLIEQYDELKDKDKQRLLQIINNASKTSLNHFDELIRIAKMENQADLFYPERLLLNKEVGEDIKLISQIAEQKNITINNKIKKNVFVHADKIMLKSIIQNILTNAIKYSFEGGKVDIFSTSFNKMEQITIRDKGIGMSKEIQDDLFGYDTVKSKKGTVGEKGSGLGLRIVKDFVEKHHGEISVESKKGKGTSISFTLPEAP
ncbi:MAG: ATP-binding protein [Bacteroidota bacterium]|nr:ATP-binding protein [Bacteroidota bacterium]